jgi:uncharacterized protein (TIGR00266 family)
MELVVRHNPSFSVVRAEMGPNEEIRGEAGAMMAMSADTTLDAKMEGGLMKGLKRSVLGGESMFITKATAGPGGGWIDFAAALPGDVVTHHLAPEHPMLVQRGSYLCSGPSVEIDTKWGGFRNLFGGEGGFLIRATGAGPIALSTYGALDTLTLAAGETVVVDSGHMVAFDEAVTMELKKANDSVLKSLKSAEGLVFVFTGPGRVMMQSRNPKDMIGYLVANMPGQRA